ncbi:acylneuraminate cytidylyltransferase [Escherichia coli]|nr:acylneuraminate cytidylyltransferase [Escherichia coli]EEV0161269.1 acylneuraminate cytidylyltransferase [Escherichia coli]EEW6903950.1 acylneuraminate cytidylyltransferase [Escherichia coli]EEX4856341.1 acylneuraminate cytidylyltransferase [Escherichia coli]EEX9559251.1 acylneuraminate cytidylyltransferase [Escherichia coli]
MSLKKIAIIPARSGSKGLPNKNILMLLDRPLIAYTIEAAISSNIFDKIIVSTDSLEYKYIAEKYGAEVILRTKELSSDSATSFMVVQDVLEKCPVYDYFVLLQPTSPFRNYKHIKNAVEQFENNHEAKFLVSVVESDKSSALIKPIDNSLSLRNFDCDFSTYRRQNKKEYCPNGAIFIGYVSNYLRQKHFFGADSIAYIMNKEDSIDIDDQLDFELAILIQTKKNKKKLLDNAIIKRIVDKKDLFNKVEQITLIGHSIFDYWDLSNICGIKVNNLGIAGIDSEKYYKYIIEKNMLTNIGKYVLLISGTNDIVNDGWTIEYTIKWTKNLINRVKIINPDVTIILLAVPPVRGRVDRDNNTINKLNLAMKQYFSKLDNVIWMPLSPSFYDEFGNLNENYTYDGLHFTLQAYKQLENDISSILK